MYIYIYIYLCLLSAVCTQNERTIPIASSSFTAAADAIHVQRRLQRALPRN